MAVPPSAFDKSHTESSLEMHGPAGATLVYGSTSEQKVVRCEVLLELAEDESVFIHTEIYVFSVYCLRWNSVDA